ncbi:MAG: ABC transporter permease [Cyclobacteriaceae bacterium]|nr:ABC transporter permease [Cyclobacteriaceae bacterium]
MNLSFFIARRYFASRRKKNFIHVISILSMVGVAFVTAALIVVLSVFNGLEVLLRSLYTSFDPELKIEAVQGKSFPVSDSLLQGIRSVPGVQTVTEVIEDYAYIRYREAAMVVTVKGVSENFLDQHRLDDHIVEGDLKLMEDSIPFAILGRGVRYTLTAEVEDDSRALRIFYIRNVKSGVMNPASLYAQKSIRPGSVFSIEKNYDENFIFVPLSFARDLFEFGNKRTSIEVLTKGATLDVQKALTEKLGARFTVLTNEEQHKDLYRLLKIEKLFTFLSLSLLLLVASINIFFSLMMLTIDKKKDISVLASIGAPASIIRNIFLAEGAIISFLGAGVGLLIGGLLCFLQDTVGLVGMGMANAVVSNYPVQMRPLDFVLTGLVIIGISFLVSFRPAVLAARSYSIEHL